MLVLLSGSEEETEELAGKLSSCLPLEFTISLEGDLGAGKTAFTRGLARGFAVLDVVNSPTFTLLNVYEGKVPIYHFDFYRIDEEDEMLELDLDEYFYGHGISVVEWGNKFPESLPAEYLLVKLERTETLDERKITLIPQGELPQKVLKEMSNHVCSGN